MEFNQDWYGCLGNTDLEKGGWAHQPQARNGKGIIFTRNRNWNCKFKCATWEWLSTNSQHHYLMSQGPSFPHFLINSRSTALGGWERKQKSAKKSRKGKQWVELGKEVPGSAGACRDHQGLGHAAAGGSAASLHPRWVGLGLMWGSSCGWVRASTVWAKGADGKKKHKETEGAMCL